MPFNFDSRVIQRKLKLPKFTIEDNSIILIGPMNFYTVIKFYSVPGKCFKKRHLDKCWKCIWFFYGLIMPDIKMGSIIGCVDLFKAESQFPNQITWLCPLSLSNSSFLFLFHHWDNIIRLFVTFLELFLHEKKKKIHVVVRAI